MENAYKMALQIILSICKKEKTYMNVEGVRTICEIALGEEEGEKCETQEKN